MAGLTSEGFIALTQDEIRTRIESRLTAYNSGFDFTTESPDGQLIEIFGFELATAWSELDLVYNSFDPDHATGAGLRNIGLMTGLPRAAATRSEAVIDLIGVSGTVVPQGSRVTSADGTEFATEFQAIIPASVSALAIVSGATPMPVGTISTIKSVIAGWTSINQPIAGRTGAGAQTEPEYRNKRNSTVLRNFTSVPSVIQARLFELGIEQATIINNDSLVPLPDGTPAGSIHVTVGEIDNLTNEEIAQVILLTKSLGCPTYGSTTVSVNDAQGNPHDISFSRATAVPVWIDLDVTYLSDDLAGATEDIRAALVTHINGLLSGEDVIHSRLYGLITPFGKAQINSLAIGRTLGSAVPANLVINEDEYASTENSIIAITIT